MKHIKTLSTRDLKKSMKKGLRLKGKNKVIAVKFLSIMLTKTAQKEVSNQWLKHKDKQMFLVLIYPEVLIKKYQL